MSGTKRKVDEIEEDKSATLPVTKAAKKPFVLDKYILKVYYARLFPTATFFKWLNYGDNSGETIHNREFSFTLEGDIYIRYCSFQTKEEFKQALLSKMPIKIDIGAVFNAPPKMHTSINKFAPVEKELVFDIDMTDYDDVRKCCSGADICSRCWPLMTAAIHVTNHALREGFGFEHLMWVYSGRRGVHCWVCDDRARKLSNEARTAVVEYLSIYMGSDNNRKMDLYTPLHPSLRQAYDVLEKYFSNTWISSQNLFETSKDWNEILEMVDQRVRDRFTLSGNSMEKLNGEQKWEFLKKKVNAFLSNKTEKRKVGWAAHNTVVTLLQRVVFTHLYPRLDVNVSKQLNHLLKAPFCIHPKTGRVCVPIDPERAGSFDPFSVPTLSQLEDELNVKGADTSKPAWQRTSLAPFLEFFQDFVKPLSHPGGSKTVIKMEDDLEF